MTVIFISIVLISAFIAGYSVHRMAAGAGLPRLYVLLLCLGAALLGALHQALLSIGNYYDFRSLYYPLLITAATVVLGTLVLPWALAYDALTLILSRFFINRFKSQSFKLWRHRLTRLFILIYVPLALFATYEGVRVPEIKAVPLSYSALPEELSGLKVVQVTDIHASPLFLQKRTAAIVEKVNALKPDLILVTGDQSDGTPAARAHSLEPLKNLQAPLGTYFVSGNHEYITDFKEWMDYYRKEGLKLLLNDNVTLKVGAATLAVAGLPDDSAPSRGFEGPSPDQALKGTQNADFTILLSHQPRHAAEYAAREDAPDLILSGHTHGGQISYLKGVTANANSGFVEGLYQLRHTLLYVSDGSGLWCGYVPRLGTSGEITLFTLSSK